MKENIQQLFSKFLKISKKIVKHPVTKKTFLVLLILTFLGTWQIRSDFQQIEQVLSESISAEATYKDFHLLISKINVNAPIIADVGGKDKDTYFSALEKGVAHLKGSSKPGEGSNIFIFGHSSFYADRPGKYKEVFRSLEDLVKGDEIIIWHGSKEYKYKISETKTVDPQEVDVLKPTKQEQVTLMTCVPPGTILKRFIVIGKPE